MSISKLQADMKGLRVALGRIAAWWQLLERAINHLDATTEELNDIPSDVAMVVRAIQNNSEEIAVNWEAFQQTLLRIIVIRAARSDANMFGLGSGLSCAILQATIDMIGTFDSTLLPESAESGEMSEMAEVIQKIAKSETNGEAIVALSGYRKLIRARVISQCNARLAEERAVKSSNTLRLTLSEEIQDNQAIDKLLTAIQTGISPVHTDAVVTHTVIVNNDDDADGA